MDENRRLPRLSARREELQYRIYGNNEQIKYMRAPGWQGQDREQAIGNLMTENALYQAEIEEIDFVTDRNVENGRVDWSMRAYMLLVSVATIVALLAVYGLARAL